MSWIWVLWPVIAVVQVAMISSAVWDSHGPFSLPRLPFPPRPRPRRRPLIVVESWSQPWPCPHRDGWSLAWGLTSHGPSAEHVRAHARCSVCGGRYFEDPTRPVPDRFPSRA